MRNKRVIRAQVHCVWRLFGILAFTGMLASCKPPPQQPPPPKIIVDKKQAMSYVREIVAIQPRVSGTENALKTAELIAETCRGFGLKPVIDKWTEKAAGRPVEFRNVYVELKGRADGYIVVGSHFDTKLLRGTVDFQGANDGASSTGLLLEIIRVLNGRETWEGPTLLFAFFDGEECVSEYSHDDGLHGSKRYVDVLIKDGRLKAVKAMVLLDMIGDKDLTLTLSPDDDIRLRNKVFKISEELGMRDKVKMFNRNILDDHVPFKNAGIPAIDLIDFEYGPNNNYWHTKADSLDKLSEDSLESVGNLTIRLLQDLNDF